MNTPQVRSIRSVSTIHARVALPPSKSYTNRALIAAALAEGDSTLFNTSEGDDANYLVSGLGEFGIKTRKQKNSLTVKGSGGKLEVPSREIFVGNAGTAMRFLTTFSSLAAGETTLTGDEQMQKRPLGDLLDSLRLAGIKCSSNNGCPPVTIRGGDFVGGHIEIKGDMSSQFISSILLSSPYARQPVVLRVKGPSASLPYVNMTLHVMRSFGANVDSLDARVYTVSNRDRYIGQKFHIEPDASSASYFLAAAAITQGRVFISKLSTESLQGDVKFLNILGEMGCKFTQSAGGMECHGSKLYGLELDMNQLPDCVPTLAVVAMFADGSTTIENVGHLRVKETDRLSALATELRKLGARVDVFDDGMTIRPGPLHGATIETYNDHRMAMSFAVAGLRIPGVKIENPSCVSKSFPGFWEEFKKLEEQA